ncbi:hypothetical protein QTP88_023847 [Uroleucon formosanum]
MSDTKVVVRLKPRVFPTIFSIQKSISFTSTSSDSNRQERMSRKREKDIVLKLLKTSTPKKRKDNDVHDEVFDDENVNDDLYSNSADYDTSFIYLSNGNSSSEKDIDVKFKDSESMTDTSINACFIIFWESLLILFKSCNICSGKIIKYKHFVQGAFLSVNTTCEEGHLYQGWPTLIDLRSTSEFF